MRKIVVPVAIMVVAVGIFALLKATRPAAPQVVVSERVWQVAAETLHTAELAPEVTLYGQIEAPDRLHAAAPLNGRIHQLRVREGASVEAGELLLAMDPQDVQPRLTQAQAELEREQLRNRQDVLALEQDRQLVSLAEAKLERAERLSASQLGSERERDQAREELARARLALMQRELAIAEHPARLSLLQTKLAEAQRDSQRAQVVAPFAAMVGPVEVAVGDQVSAGRTLLTLYPLNRRYMRARLPERYVPEVRAALMAQQRLPATVSYAGEEYTAQLERLGSESDLRGVDVWLSLADAAAIPVGALVSARLQGPLVSAVALPYSALHGGERIYVVEAGRLRAQPVSLIGERRHNGRVEMLLKPTGLPDGVQVITTHLPNAINGLRVEVLGQ